MSLTAKYQLMSSESPPTLKRKENFSAISGPLLPSGPILPTPTVHQREYEVYLSDDDDSSSTSSDDTIHDSWSQTLAHTETQQANRTKQVIKPRERPGQFLHPLTMKMASLDKNSLDVIGTSALGQSIPVTNAPAVTSPKNGNPFLDDSEELEEKLKAKVNLVEADHKLHNISKKGPAPQPPDMTGYNCANGSRNVLEGTPKSVQKSKSSSKIEQHTEAPWPPASPLINKESCSNSFKVSQA